MLVQLTSLSGRFYLSLIVTAFIVTGAHAQVLEEVVVTAQKREQQLQDVGISVTAFSGDQMKELGFTDTTEISMHTPGLQTFNFGNNAASVFVVRGVGQLDFADHQEQASAVFVDGAYNSYLGGIGFALYDIERTEVLKGPQGTLFGRNATGGVIHVITAKPTREFEAYGEVQLGEYDEYRGEFAVSGPISNTLSARVAAVKHIADGFVDNSLGQDGHDTDNTNGRLQLLWEPNEDFEVLIGGRFGTYDNNNPTYLVDRAINDNFTNNGGAITGGSDDGLTKPASAQGYADFRNGFWAGGITFVPGAFPASTPASVGCLGQGLSGFGDPHETALLPGSKQTAFGVAGPARGTKDGRSDREQYGFTGTIT